MTWLKENWFKVVIVVLAMAILGAAFYWYEVRPANVYSYCSERAKEKAKESESLDGSIKVYDVVYKSCLREKGLDK